MVLNVPIQTVAVLGTFMLAMVLYPDVFEKAQAEIDRIIGPNRLPDLSDRNTLPYLEATIAETLRYVSFYNIRTSLLIQHDGRWNTPLPLGRINLCEFSHNF